MQSPGRDQPSGAARSLSRGQSARSLRSTCSPAPRQGQPQAPSSPASVGLAQADPHSNPTSAWASVSTSSSLSPPVFQVEAELTPLRESCPRNETAPQAPSKGPAPASTRHLQAPHRRHSWEDAFVSHAELLQSHLGPPQPHIPPLTVGACPGLSPRR